MAFKEKTSAAKKYLAVFCFLWIMVLLPLYYRYAYFDMIEAKASALRAVLYAVCFGTLVFAAASCFGRDKKGVSCCGGHLLAFCGCEKGSILGE